MSIEQHEHIAAPPSAKIIPLRPESWLLAERDSFAPPAERGRHFLKVTLPAIPVAVFTLTFLSCYALEASDATQAGRAIDPLPVLLSTIGLTIVVGGLCALIYRGYRHIAGLPDRD